MGFRVILYIRCMLGLFDCSGFAKVNIKLRFMHLRSSDHQDHHAGIRDSRTGPEQTIVSTRVPLFPTSVIHGKKRRKKGQHILRNERKMGCCDLEKHMHCRQTIPDYASDSGIPESMIWLTLCISYYTRKDLPWNIRH